MRISASHPIVQNANKMSLIKCHSVDVVWPQLSAVSCIILTTGSTTSTRMRSRRIKELYSDDGEISAMFLPHNTTALIQPMDQNVIQNIKLGYRKLLLTNILNDPVHNENLEKTLTNVHLKDVVFSLANCWTFVSTLLINK
ncbi:hypothetical protein AVEN_61865-1 [Araneus ventricosus]|uniref:DDE-1 domain-containing protein n=1 Tax=Araneus ventricosus TaxID=182803 RepID=A0A4Y2WMS6_ARAVE|nr:hypothetical protein AVEN_61865-1 [Araneus ventricosus]